MRNVIKTMLYLILLTGSLIPSAYAQDNKSNAKQVNENAAADAAPVKILEGLSIKNPMRIDEKAQTVSILVKVNGKYLTESTRHGIVYQGGSNADKPIFIDYVAPKDFYNALIKIKAKPGNNMTFDNKEKTKVSGDKLSVSFYWAGAKRSYDINEVIKDSNGKKIDIHFGGNLKASINKNTGCILCLDSCPVGIVSNASYTYGAVEHRGEVKFSGNASVLPANDSLVVVTFKLAK